LDPTDPLYQRPIASGKSREKICNPISQACTVSTPNIHQAPESVRGFLPEICTSTLALVCGQWTADTEAGFVSPGYPSRACCERDADQGDQVKCQKILSCSDGLQRCQSRPGTAVQATLVRCGALVRSH